MGLGSMIRLWDALPLKILYRFYYLMNLHIVMQKTILLSILIMRDCGLGILRQRKTEKKHNGDLIERIDRGQEREEEVHLNTPEAISIIRILQRLQFMDLESIIKI